MKVLIVSAHDLHGGASRAAYRLHSALRRIQVDSTMLVQQRTSDDPDVIGHSGSAGRVIGGLRTRLDRLPLLRYSNRSDLWFSPSWVPGRRIVRRINLSEADVVHLHWIAGGMMRVEDLEQIDKPLVWTLHDMWPMTGGCHYDAGCGRFVDSCGACPQLGDGSPGDLSAWVFQRKMQSFSKVTQLHLVASSNWMSELLRASPIMSGRPVTVLPNPVDIDTFRPVDRHTAREALNLSMDAKLVLFGAVRPDNPIKGYDLLRQALKGFTDGGNYQALVFGASHPVSNDLPIECRYVGPVSEDSKLRDLYSAADVFVVPSIQDNLPLVATESLSCGTPVVAFNATGLPDIVDHRRTGYLATPFEPAALAKGIRWAVAQPVDEIRQKCRETAVRRYESASVARSYADLYSEVLRSTRV